MYMSIVIAGLGWCSYYRSRLNFEFKKYMYVRGVFVGRPLIIMQQRFANI